MIAILGAGIMGAHHARTVARHPGVELGLIVDVDEDRARRLADDHGAKWATDPSEACACDAAIVAVPTELHLSSVLPLLEADCPVLVEKPAAATAAEVRSMVDVAFERGVPLLCGFVERFNPVVRTALELIDEQPVHLVAIRHSPTTPRTTTSVVHDLLIHDIDLALLFGGGREVRDVRATRSRPVGAAVDEIADCSLMIEGGMVATLSASRVGQRKLRTVLVSMSDRLLELDLLRQDLTVFRHVDHELLHDEKGYRAETVIDIPFVRHAGEPLELQLTYFLDLIDGVLDPDRELDTILAPHEVAELVDA